MRPSVGIPVSLFLALLTAGCSTSQPIQNFEGEPVPVALGGSSRSAEEVREARNYNKWVILLSQAIQRQFDAQ